MNPTPTRDLEPIARTLAAAATSQTPSWPLLLVVALPIMLPGSLMANTILPLPVRGVNAIVCGLAVLLCGPYLMSHALLLWARRLT